MITPDEPICIFSPCEKYRYTLWREVNPNGEGYVQWIALNPSTADETKDDPTVRRMQGFSRDWGARYCLVTNVFAFRATNPRDMKAQHDPWGPTNMHHIQRLAKHARMVVAAWGVHGAWMRADLSLQQALSDIPLKCLGKTKDGQPRHPLYIKATQSPIEYS
jgi:hypothetical protein